MDIQSISIPSVEIVMDDFYCQLQEVSAVTL